MITKLSNKERRIIMGLRNNGRERINMIAKQYGYPISTMFDVLHRLEENKILAHKSRVNFEDIGFPAKVFVTVKTCPEQREPLRKFLVDQKNINTIHKINGGYDYHFEIIGKNTKESQDIIDEMNTKFMIEEMHTFNVIETLQYEKFLTQEYHFE